VFSFKLAVLRWIWVLVAIQAGRESAALLRIITQSSSESVFKCETTSEPRIESGPDPSLGRSLGLHTGPDPGLGEGQSRTTYQGQGIQVVFKVNVDVSVKVKVKNKVSRSRSRSKSMSQSRSR